MKQLILIVLIIWSLQSYAQVKVKGYYRKDGTYVQPHYRSNPDGNPYNNWSYPGNVNPYTGKIATGNPSTYLNNYYNRNSSTSSYTNPSSIDLPNSNVNNSYSSSLSPLSYYVTSNKLNVRTKPSTSSSVLTTLNYGDKVEVVSNDDYPWYAIKITYYDLKDFSTNTSFGYVHSSFLSSPSINSAYLDFNLPNASSLSTDKAVTYNSYNDEDIVLIAIDSLETNPNLSLQLVGLAEKRNIIDDKTRYEIEGWAYENLGQYNSALNSIDKEINMPGSLTYREMQYCRIHKGRLLIESGKPDNAIKELEHTILSNANDTMSLIIYNYKIAAYSGLKNYADMISFSDKYLSKAYELGEQRENILIIKQQKAIALRELGRYTEALNEIDEAINEDNTNSLPFLYTTRGIIFYNAKKYSSAANEFIKATLLDEKDDTAYYYLGMSYKNLDQKNKACENLLKAVKLGNKNALNMYPTFCQ